MMKQLSLVRDSPDVQQVHHGNSSSYASVTSRGVPAHVVLLYVPSGNRFYRPYICGAEDKKKSARIGRFITYLADVSRESSRGVSSARAKGGALNK